MKFNLPTSFFGGADPLGRIFLIGWIIYVVVYWICLFQILRATKFETGDKILWFLVITMAPVLGIVAYLFLCPPFVRNNAGPNDNSRGPSSPV
ncbi:MAG: PLDc N-terminal domain-containing protein [Verrucomicrobiaceae bacterium]|nr:PLDc N-terminal domain-containing protein [Verrucomicrobiaceae bacterium]